MLAAGLLEMGGRIWSAAELGCGGAGTGKLGREYMRAMVFAAEAAGSTRLRWFCAVGCIGKI
jgi:hypothetical protein